MRSSAGRFLSLCLLLLAAFAAMSTRGEERDPPAELKGTSGRVETRVTDDVQSELTTGRWKTVAFQSGTAKVEGAAAAAALPSEIEFGDGTIAIYHQGQQIAAATYAIDETTAPARITFETTVPRESTPGNRGRIVSFCVDGVCYSMGIEDAPKELFPEPKVKTTVAFRVDGDRLEMQSVPEPAVASDESASSEATPTLRIVYERIEP